MACWKRWKVRASSACVWRCNRSFQRLNLLTFSATQFVSDCKAYFQRIIMNDHGKIGGIPTLPCTIELEIGKGRGLGCLHRSRRCRFSAHHFVLPGADVILVGIKSCTFIGGSLEGVGVGVGRSSSSIGSVASTIPRLHCLLAESAEAYQLSVEAKRFRIQNLSTKRLRLALEINSGRNPGQAPFNSLLEALEIVLFPLEDDDLG